MPRRLLPKALTSLRSCIWRRLCGQEAGAFEYELWLCFFAGMARQCLHESREGFGRDVIGPAIPASGPGATDDVGRSVQAATTTGAGLL